MIKIITLNIRKIAINNFIYHIEMNLEEMAEYFTIILIPRIGLKILIIQKMLEQLF